MHAKGLTKGLDVFLVLDGGKWGCIQTKISFFHSASDECIAYFKKNLK